MQELLTEEQRAFAEFVRDWADRQYPKAKARQIDEEGVFPDGLWGDMAAAGFHGVGIDEAYGGQGGDVVSQVILAQGLARNLAGLSAVWGVSSFAGAKSIGVYGSDAQKVAFLPRLAAGELRFAMAVTEPDGGTDVLGNMRTRAARSSSGWVLNGQKVWSTGAHVADYLLVLALTDSAVKPSRGTTLFVVPADSPGITMSKIPALGFRPYSSNEVFFSDVDVPDDLVLTAPGEGWKAIVSTLNNERIMTAGFATGVIEGVLEVALDYCMKRTAFGRPIGQFQALQHFIADIATWKTQSELLTWYAARLQSAGLPCGAEATMAKLVSSECAFKAADLGIQILGGMGYSRETDMQRYFRDSRVYRIAPISSEMARNMIAESYGLPRSF